MAPYVQIKHSELTILFNIFLFLYTVHIYYYFNMYLRLVQDTTRRSLVTVF